MVINTEEQDLLDAALKAEQQAQQQAQQLKQQQQELNLKNALLLSAAIVSPQAANAAVNPMMNLIGQLNPQLQQNLGQMVNSINQWNSQFGNTPLNQLDAAAINSHPLMQPNAQNQQSMIQGLGSLAQSANLSPELQGGLTQLNQFMSSMNNLPPSSTVGQAANAASSLMNAGAGLSAAVPAAGAVVGLVNVVSKMESMLGKMMNPAAAQDQTPGAEPSEVEKVTSSLSSMIKGMMKPPGPGAN